MSNLGLPEFLAILVVVLLVGSPAILAIAILGLRRAAQQSPLASAGSAPAAQAHLCAAGYVRADGSLQAATPGWSVARLQTGIYQVMLPEGLDPQRCLLQATPVATQAGDEPALVEVLGHPARDQALAAAAADDVLLVWVRLANRQPVDRDWTFQVVGWA